MIQSVPGITNFTQTKVRIAENLPSCRPINLHFNLFGYILFNRAGICGDVRDFLFQNFNHPKDQMELYLTNPIFYIILLLCYIGISTLLEQALGVPCAYFSALLVTLMMGYMSMYKL